MHPNIAIWSWDKDHLTQHKMAISLMYKFFKNVKANYRKVAIM